MKIRKLATAVFFIGCVVLIGVSIIFFANIFADNGIEDTPDITMKALSTSFANIFHAPKGFYWIQGYVSNDNVVHSDTLYIETVDGSVHLFVFIETIWAKGGGTE